MLDRRSFLRTTAAAAAGAFVACTLDLRAEEAPPPKPPEPVPPGKQTLIAELVAAAKTGGVAFLGAAAMGPVYAKAARPVEQKDQLPVGLAIGVRLSPDTMDNVVAQPEAYGAHHYREALPKAVAVAQEFVKLLGARGHRTALGVGGVPFLPEQVAMHAGLGWIGKCGRLVTPQIGPRIVWATVLTDAPLASTAEKPIERRCADCHTCVDQCPSKALQDLPADPLRPFITYDLQKCLKYRREQGAVDGKGACGRCLSICPCGGRKALLSIKGGPAAGEKGAAKT